jgi:hypothetical protein
MIIIIKDMKDIKNKNVKVSEEMLKNYEIVIEIKNSNDLIEMGEKYTDYYYEKLDTYGFLWGLNRIKLNK